jgi:hypothetical protein
MTNRIRATILGLLLFINCSALAAGPFGFDPSLAKEQILKMLGPSAIKEVKGDIYRFNTAPQPHPDFEFYSVIFSDSKVVKVSAYTKDIETNVYGDDLKAKFKDLSTALTAKYGTGDAVDTLRAGSIWKEPEDWMMGLVKDERTLTTFWKVDNGDLHAIMLEANGLSRNKGYISLQYEYVGFAKWVENYKSKQNSVF